MGSGQSDAAAEATRVDLQTQQEEFKLGISALTPATNYLMAEAIGGQEMVNKELAPKFSAKMTDVLEQTAAGPSGGSYGQDIQSLEHATTAQALGRSGVAQERVGQGLDTINKIKALLGGQGLKTTGLAQQASGLESSSIGLMAKNPTLSTILAGGAALSAAYGGYQGYKAGQSVQAEERAATYAAQAGPPGGDVSTLTSFTPGPRG